MIILVLNKFKPVILINLI